MTDIEQKALALVDDVQCERSHEPVDAPNYQTHAYVALCRAIEQHDAFRQEVSDALKKYFSMDWNTHNMVSDLHRFIITKPDPLVEVLEQSVYGRSDQMADRVRAALEARGLEIREKGK